MARLLIHALPSAVTATLMAQLSPPHEVHEDRLPQDNAAPDLIITAENTTAPVMARGVPVLTLDTSGEQRTRLGFFLRMVEQVLEDPALYLAPFPVGGYVFDAPEKTMQDVDAVKTIALTDREVDIIVYLAKNAGRTVGRDELLKNVWKYQSGVDTHTLETHVYRLRQKIETDAENPALLVTESSGYRLLTG